MKKPQFKIEKNVPLTSLQYRNHPTYPFGELKVGNSFYVEGEVTKRSLRAAAYAYGRYHGGKFSTRTDENGIRVWRTE